MKRSLAPVLVLLMALLQAGCVVSKNPVTGRSRPLAYTWAQEVQLGKQADTEITAAYGVYDDDALTNYVTGVGQAVLAQSHLRRPDTDPEFKNTPFTFRVLDSPVVNAFALPGGYVYVTRGLLSHLENEAQLAVVLGHEVGHVAARHASQQALKQQLLQGGALAGAILGEAVLGQGAGQTILDVGSTAAQLLSLRYSRDAEREADKLGVEYSSLAHYVAADAAPFFTSLQRITEQSGQAIPGFLSTHPDPGDRHDRILLLAGQWAQRVNVTRVDQSQYLHDVEGLVYGDDPRQGFTKNGRFYHPQLRFQFSVPPSFQVVNQPRQVVMVEENQRAVLVMTLADAGTAQAAATAFAQQNGLQIVDSGASRSGALPAYYVTADAQTDQGQQLRLLAYFVEYDGNVYRFVGYSAAESFAAYHDVFLRTMTSFAALHDPNILLVQPARLTLVTTRRTGPFSSFLPQTLPHDVTAEDLAILNQVGVDEQIPAGTILKLVR